MNHYSIAAWHKFKDDGRLTTARRKVYQGLCVHGPCTAQELVKALGYPGAWKRLSELELQRFIVRDGSKVCDITGETSTVWAIDPDAEPIKYVPPRSDKLTMAQRMELLEKRVAELEAATKLPKGQINLF